MGIARRKEIQTLSPIEMELAKIQHQTKNLFSIKETSEVLRKENNSLPNMEADIGLMMLNLGYEKALLARNLLNRFFESVEKKTSDSNFCDCDE